MASAYGNQVTNELSQMFSPENVMANQARKKQAQEQNALAQIMQKHQGNVDSALPEIAQVSPEYAFKVDAMRKAQQAAQAQANKPVSMAAGGVLFDPVTRQPIFTAPTKPEKLPDWKDPEYLRYQRELEKFKVGLKPSTVTTATPQKPIYDTASNEWVYPPSEEFPQGKRTGDVAKLNAVTAAKDLISDFIGTPQKPGLIATTPTGGWMGASGQLGRVTDSQKSREFNNMREAISTQMRAVFRIPGEGALSDKEQAQYGLQLPDISNDKDVNERILQRMARALETRASSTQVSPSSPQQSSGKVTQKPLKVGDMEDGHVYIGGDPANPASWRK